MEGTAETEIPEDGGKAVVNCKIAKSSDQDDYQNSTFVQELNNNVVKKAISTSTPNKQQISKSKKYIKDFRHLWVYNINPSTLATKLKEDLSKFGKALQAKILKNGENYYGYALMENAACLQACIDNLHNKCIDGYRLELSDQAPNVRNSKNDSDELKLSSEKRSLDKKEAVSSKKKRKVTECCNKGISDLDIKNKKMSPPNEKTKSNIKVDNDRNKEQSIETKEKRSVTSRSSYPPTLKVQERNNSPETSEGRLKKVELEIERMRQYCRNHERQLEREKRTLLLKKQNVIDRLKLTEEKRKLDEEKSKLNDDKQNLENEKQKLSIERQTFEDDLKKNRTEVESLQKKVHEWEAKQEEKRRKRKLKRISSKGKQPGSLNSNKENNLPVHSNKAYQNKKIKKPNNSSKKSKK